jgi:hypothetical protein
MASKRKITASRNNGQKSRGPRTDAGKRRSSSNALRHGLTKISRRNSVYADEIKEMANAICEGDDNILLLEQALIIAECEVLLRCINSQSVQLVERLRHSVALPIAQGTKCAKLLSARLHQDWRDITFLEIQFAAYNKDQLAGAKQGLQPPDKSSWSFTFVNERDEYSAFCEAIPDLQRFARYERRARSRQKRALNQFIAIKALGQKSKSDSRAAAIAVPPAINTAS